MPSTTKFAVAVIGKRILRGRIVWIAALFGVGWSAHAVAQPTSKNLFTNAPVVAVTFDLEDAQGAPFGGDFWLKGGAVDVAVPIYRHLSIAGNFSGAHVSNVVNPGVNLGKISYLAGPRYTFSRSSRVSLFGEGLFGGTHGFDSIFPTSSGLTPTANSYAIQLGGGTDIRVGGGFGLRALEVDYVRTGLPNNGANNQNDLRLAFGASYQFSRK